MGASSFGPIDQQDLCSEFAIAAGAVPSKYLHLITVEHNSRIRLWCQISHSPTCYALIEFVGLTNTEVMLLAFKSGILLSDR